MDSWGSSFYKTAEWKELRKQCIARDKACVQCGATVNLRCDHIVNVANGGQHNLENLQALCINCHERKSIAERLEGIEKRRLSGIRKDTRYLGKKRR